ncbi:MAG TPA: type II secretion system protein [Pyrodictium sp.]|nr:type II secretion system protein [Pyrodictium sp.]
MKKNAFTMLELVMVLVVIGILAALAIPRMDRDIRQEAADNILSAIRYTQHLALMDNKTNPSDPEWQKKLWHIRFERYGGNTPTTWFYSISSSMDGNRNIDIKEVAIDPANGLRMNNTNSATGIGLKDSPSVFISEHYGIEDIKLTGGCSENQHIGFDHLGRPHVNIYDASNDYRSYMSSDCKMTFKFSDSSIKEFKIIIEQETGHAYIDGQPNS